MNKEKQTCGNCGWWDRKETHERSIEWNEWCNVCLWPSDHSRPFYTPDYYDHITHYDDGAKCRCWKEKSDE